MRENTIWDYGILKYNRCIGRSVDLFVPVSAFPPTIIQWEPAEAMFSSRKKKSVNLLVTFILPKFPIKLPLFPNFAVARKCFAPIV